jgi:3-methyladenine DNA glycosylase AlkC
VRLNFAHFQHEREGSLTPFFHEVYVTSVIVQVYIYAISDKPMYYSVLCPFLYCVNPMLILRKVVKCLLYASQLNPCLSNLVNYSSDEDVPIRVELRTSAGPPSSSLYRTMILSVGRNEIGVAREVMKHVFGEARNSGYFLDRESIFHSGNIAHMIEVNTNFRYIAIMGEPHSNPPRKGARRIAAVPPSILRRLAAGQIETVNLMEWLAADMTALAVAASKDFGRGPLAKALRCAGKKAAGRPITERLSVFGSAIAGTGIGFDDPDFLALTNHRCDLVRQWACYAVNDRAHTLTLKKRLQLTLVYASDRNMTVRETAWMAFRPHVHDNLTTALGLLQDVVSREDANKRRFAIEVCRPRSVWGVHITHLKRCPELGEPLLEEVRTDSSRYVQLAAGNWINDAAKSRPDWALSLCDRWMQTSHPETQKIVVRGLRTLRARRICGAAGLSTGPWPVSLRATQ